MPLKSARLRGLSPNGELLKRNRVFPVLSDKILMNYEVRIKVFETGFVCSFWHPLILAPIYYYLAIIKSGKHQFPASLQGHHNCVPAAILI